MLVRKENWGYLLIFVDGDALEELAGELGEEGGGVWLDPSHALITRLVRGHIDLELLNFGLDVANQLRVLGLLVLHLESHSMVNFIIYKWDLVRL